MTNTWIDLTDIELWSGHHGGTQRVVYGITKNYYLEENNNVRFFAYSPQNNVFYETSFTPIYERVEALKNQNVSHDSQHESFKQKVKKKLVHYAPAYVKNNKELKNNIKFVAKKTLTVARYVNNARIKHLKTNVSATSDNKHTPIEFLPEDIILILGKPWDNPGLQALLMSKKKTTDFKVVQVVYDLIISLYPHLHHPSLFRPYTQHMFDAVCVSDLMLPISRSTDKDLKKFCKMLNLPIPMTKVIRLGDELELPEELLLTSSKPDVYIENEYLLCVGTIENRKNHMLLYQAYKLAEERKIQLPQLVIVGGLGWLTDDVRYLLAHDPMITNKITVLNNVSDSSLAWLYQHCLMTVYPSLYEGWGLPVAESLAYGKVCVSSSVSSMPEIAGDLVDYFSPYDTNECLSIIEKYITHPKLVASREKEIHMKYRSTKWYDTFKQVKHELEKFN